MNRKTVIKLAEEAKMFPTLNLEYQNQQLHNFAELVAAHEREECAKVCDPIRKPINWSAVDQIKNECATTIRARKP